MMQTPFVFHPRVFCTAPTTRRVVDGHVGDHIEKGLTFVECVEKREACRSVFVERRCTPLQQ